MAKVEEKAVEILFDGLTHNGKLYRKGEIEPKPTPHLIECAKNKTTYWHSDEKKNIRLCRFTSKSVPEDNERITLEALEKLSDFELIRILVKEHGLSRKKVCDFSREKLEDYVLRLQE